MQGEHSHTAKGINYIRKCASVLTSDTNEKSEFLLRELSLIQMSIEKQCATERAFFGSTANVTFFISLSFFFGVGNATFFVHLSAMAARYIFEAFYVGCV